MKLILYFITYVCCHVNQNLPVMKKNKNLKLKKNLVSNLSINEKLFIRGGGDNPNSEQTEGIGDGAGGGLGEDSN